MKAQSCQSWIETSCFQSLIWVILVSLKSKFSSLKKWAPDARLCLSCSSQVSAYATLEYLLSYFLLWFPHPQEHDNNCVPWRTVRTQWVNLQKNLADLLDSQEIILMVISYSIIILFLFMWHPFPFPTHRKKTCNQEVCSSVLSGTSSCLEWLRDTGVVEIDTECLLFHVSPRKRTCLAEEIWPSLQGHDAGLSVPSESSGVR